MSAFLGGREMGEKLKIEYVSVDSIMPYARNAKLHPQQQVEQIKRSIKDYGMNDPIGVWHNEIVEGHGRLMACKELGITEIPIIRLEHMSDEQRKQYMLVHNQTTMNSDFDLDILSEELDSLLDFDAEFYDFDVNFGDDDEVDKHEEIKEVEYKESISVVVACENDEQAESLFEKLTEEGYICRISTL